MKADSQEMPTLRMRDGFRYGRGMHAKTFLTVVLVTTLAGCWKPAKYDLEGPGAALMVAKKYAEENYPEGEFQPDGALLQYIVTERGSDWIVSLGPEGYLGGGLEVVVRKHDMTAVSAMRTQ